MNWKSIVSAILVATTATAQTVYHLPFASRGNIIELAVANTSGMRIVPLDAGASSGIGVRIENAPAWLQFAQKEQTIRSVAAGEEEPALFVFSVDKSAPIGQEQSLSFVISNSKGERWTKEIRIAVSAPETFELFQNYPNPFNPATTIGYQLPAHGRVSLKVFNLLGQEVATLVDGEQLPGYHQHHWNASGVASGLYVYRLDVRDHTGQTSASGGLRRTMLLLK